MGDLLEPFLRRIGDSGLVSADELRALIDGLSPEQQADADQVAREMVRQKKLTAYQAQEIYRGNGRSLVLGNYVVLDKLGQGGMGMVLKAEHRRMKRMVALKIISRSVARNADAVQRFQREVEAAARLHHPNIVMAHDADEANGIHFLVMQYVEGKDLSALVKQHGPLSAAKAVDYILQAARGLEYAHKQGVVHRDIKPSNLLVDREGIVRILDMGLARIDEPTNKPGQLTVTGQLMGTVDYMAPEQALDTKRADARADIYSLGASLWYLLTGQPLFRGDSFAKRLMAHQSGPIPSLEDHGVAASAALVAAFERMVAKSPDDRFANMTQVIAALATCQTGPSAMPAIGPAAGPRSGDDSRFGQLLREQHAAAVSSAPAEVSPRPTPGTGHAATVRSAHTHTQTAGTPPAMPRILAARPQASDPLAVRRWSRHWMMPGLAAGLATAGLGIVWLWPDPPRSPAHSPEAPSARTTPAGPAGPSPTASLSTSFPSAATSDAPVDLLRLLAPELLQVRWSLDNGVLVNTPSRGPAVQELPYAVPPSYRLEATIERAAEQGVLHVSVLVGTSRTQIALDLNQRTGISDYDRLPSFANANPTMYGAPLFRANVPREFVIEVSPHSVWMTCDGQTIIDWRGDASVLSGEARFSGAPDKLWLSASGRPFRISRLTLAPLRHVPVARGPSSADVLSSLATPADQWSAPESLGPNICSPSHERLIALTESDRTIWFLRDGKLLFSRRPTPQAEFPLAELVPGIEQALVLTATVAPDGLQVLFGSRVE
ncbi:MAG: serine/threonine protein kinase, partial [Pirellulaceae bacterium]